MIKYYINAFKKYATFKGRASRKEYWSFFFTQLLIIGVLGLPTKFKIDIPYLEYASFIMLGIYMLIAIIPTLAINVRRLHDIGRSGWWLLLYLTGIGGIVILVFLLTGSDEGKNKYGPLPTSID